MFEEDARQEDIFRRTRADFLIKQVLIGFHATIFVYGQTGSGKTFTMEGYKYVRSNNNQMVPQINRKAALSELGTKPSSSLEAVDQVSSPRAEASAPGLPDEGVIPRAIRELFA